MPIYTFQCEKCEHQFTRIQRMDDPNPPCSKADEDESDECGGETKKLMSPSSFHLKGGGWADENYG